MGKKYIIELVDRYNSEFKGIIVLGLTQEKQISVELIPKKSMTPYTEPEPHAEVTADAYQRGYEEGYKDGYNEPGKGKIQVGDEVIRHYKNEFMEGDDAPSIFLSEEDGHFRCLAFNGRSIMIAEYPKNQYRKTGRHFPEIAELLAKMKETDNG